DRVGLVGDGIFSFICLEPLVGFSIVFVEFFDNVGADITVGFLCSLGDFEGFSGRDIFTSLSHELLNEASNISSSKRDMLNAASNNITFSLEKKVEYKWKF